MRSIEMVVALSSQENQNTRSSSMGQKLNIIILWRFKRFWIFSIEKAITEAAIETIK
jgi:hypothetical protein